jgi:5-methylcytosine-specific restriction endonuclease McrA
MKALLKNIKDAIQGKAPLGATRSPKWQTTRKHHLEKNPTCAVCSGTEKLEVHHINPFHEKPELELDPTNLITLCESKSYGIVCHLAFGHLGDYKSSNPTVKIDSKFWNKKLKSRK